MPYGRSKKGLTSRLDSDTLDGSVRMQFRFAVQTVVAACMAELELDAIVAPTNNQPPPVLAAPRALGKHSRPDVWSFLGSQGIPNLTVPAGFTTAVYDLVGLQPARPGVHEACGGADQPSGFAWLFSGTGRVGGSGQPRGGRKHRLAS